MMSFMSQLIMGVATLAAFALCCSQVLYSFCIWLVPLLFEPAASNRTNGSSNAQRILAADLWTETEPDFWARALCLCTCGVALVCLLLDRALAYEHTCRLRRRGFLVFHRRLAPLRRNSLHIASFCTHRMSVCLCLSLSHTPHPRTSTTNTHPFDVHCYHSYFLKYYF